MAARCPSCNKPLTDPDRKAAPFCSERCKMADLGRWLRGDYAVPALEVDEGDGPAPVEPPSED